MKHLLATIYLLLTCIYGYSQANSDTSKVIEDSFEIQPFEVKLKTKIIMIPETGKGKVFLRLHLNEKGKIMGYEIIRYQMDNSKNQTFSFEKNINSKNIKYPNYIRKKLKFFDEFIKKKVVITKISDKNIKADNIFNIPIYINKASK